MIVGYLVGIFIGGLIGVSMMALVQIGRESDKDEQKNRAMV